MSEPLVVTIDESTNQTVSSSSPDSTPTGTDTPTLRSKLARVFKNTDQKSVFARRKKSSHTMKVNHLPTIEELLSQLDEMQTELLKKENDVRAAAEIGSALLGVNEELHAKSSNLEVLLEEKTSELSVVQAQFREHQVSHKRFMAMLEEEEKTNEAQAHEITELQQQLATIQAKHETMTRNTSNSIISTQTEIDLAMTELKEHKASKAKLEHQLTEMKNNLKREQQNSLAATEELTEAKKELVRLKKFEQKCDSLEAELSKEKKELNNLKDIQWENKTLATTCRELTSQLEAIQKIQEEDAKNYRSATAKIDELRKTLVDMKNSDHPSKSNKSNEKNEKFLSLAEELLDTVPEEKSGEIQKELDNSKKTKQNNMSVIEKNEGKEVTLSKDNLGGKENMTEEEKKERDAKFEFFALTTLAIKINSGEMMESSYMINAKDLWRKALEEQVQFHQYHRWIQTQFAKSFIYHSYQPKKISARQSRTRAIRPDHKGPERLDPATAKK